jgi:streptogramin lyase
MIIAIRRNIALPTTLFCLLTTSGSIAAQSANAPKPGVKGVQVQFGSLKPSVTLKIGGTADWVLMTNDSVWVAGKRPYSVQHIDPIANRIVAKIPLPGEACSGLSFGFGSVWVPICGKEPALVRVDVHENAVIATLPLPSVAPEGGIATSTDSVWLATDKQGTLNRIDPTTNSVRQRIPIPPDSYNPVFSDGIVWITGVESGYLQPWMPIPARSWTRYLWGRSLGF